MGEHKAGSLGVRGSTPLSSTKFIAAPRFANFLLFGVTSVELALLFVLTPTFTITDWIYVLQNLLVLGIALVRRQPAEQDQSLTVAAAIIVGYAYPYGEVIYLRWVPGEPAWATAGLVLVTAAAFLSLSSLLSIGRSFGVRPAARGLATGGPYGLVRHPMYLAYMLADVGYNLQEWNRGTVLLVLAGWVSIFHRIYAEERLLARHPGWTTYVARVRRRLIPGLW